MFLAPGAIYAGIPTQCTYPAAFGDSLTAELALIAIPAVATRARSAKILVGCSASGKEPDRRITGCGTWWAE